MRGAITGAVVECERCGLQFEGPEELRAHAVACQDAPPDAGP